MRLIQNLRKTTELFVVMTLKFYGRGYVGELTLSAFLFQETPVCQFLIGALTDNA